MGADENLDLSLANASCIDKDQMIFSHLTKIPDEMQKKKTWQIPETAEDLYESQMLAS